MEMGVCVNKVFFPPSRSSRFLFLLQVVDVALPTSSQEVPQRKPVETLGSLLLSLNPDRYQSWGSPGHWKVSRK